MNSGIAKRTMTLNLSDPEMDLLEALCSRKGVSKTALLRQAIKLYSSVEERIEQGQKVVVENPSTKEKAELIVV